MADDPRKPNAPIDPNLLSVPPSLASSDDPVEGNPYPEHSRQHRLWADATRRAEQDSARLAADWMAAMNALDRPAPATFEELEARVMAQKAKSRELAVAKFQLWATRTVSVVLSDADVLSIDQWLVDYADSCLRADAELMARYHVPARSIEDHIRYLRDSFTMLVLHYKAEARRVLELRRGNTTYGEAAMSTAPAKARTASLRNRAQWLDAALRARKWTRRDLERLGGPDARTVEKILSGQSVRATVLDKLVLVLSQKGSVTRKDIPSD